MDDTQADLGRAYERARDELLDYALEEAFKQREKELADAGRATPATSDKEATSGDR